MFLLMACTGAASLDADSDGLSDDLEAALGTDPENPDTDGDGLSDGDEHFTHGTDPTLVDTDGDGYQDGWELDEGTDPADAESRIYQGRWPYQPDKDALAEGAPDWSGPAQVGDRLPRAVWSDQYGDDVDLYDFAGHDVPVVLALCATWSAECGDLGALTVGEGGYPAVHAAIGSGDVLWLTVLTQDDANNPPSVSVLADWDADYPAGVPVLADPGVAEDAWLDVGWPTVVLLDSGLTVEAVRVDAWTDALDALESDLSGG